MLSFWCLKQPGSHYSTFHPPSHFTPILQSGFSVATLSSGFGSASGVLSPSLWFFPGTEQQEPLAKALGKACLERVLVKTQECSCGERASVFQRRELCELWLGKKSRKDVPGAWRRWEGTSPCGQPAVMHLMVMPGEQCCDQSCAGVGRGHSPGRGGGRLESKELLNQDKITGVGNRGRGFQGESTGLIWFSHVKGRTGRLRFPACVEKIWCQH